MEDKSIFLFVTEHALLYGIEICEFVRIADDGAIILKDRYGAAPADDCFESREEAIAHAEKLRDAKIASLRKQIARLERMTFGR